MRTVSVRMRSKARRHELLLIFRNRLTLGPVRCQSQRPGPEIVDSAVLERHAYVPWQGALDQVLHQEVRSLRIAREPLLEMIVEQRVRVQAIDVEQARRHPIRSDAARVHSNQRSATQAEIDQ